MIEYQMKEAKKVPLNERVGNAERRIISDENVLYKKIVRFANMPLNEYFANIPEAFNVLNEYIPVYWTSTYSEAAFKIEALMASGKSDSAICAMRVLLCPVIEFTNKIVVRGE